MDTYFKGLPNYECCIITNGKSYIFDRSGTCKKEDAGLLPAYINGAIRVNILSIVCLNGRTEIAWDKPNGEFKKFETSDGANIMMSKLMVKRGFSHFLKRNGSLDNNGTSIRYTQMFFVYPKDYNIDSILIDLKVKEVV